TAVGARMLPDVLTYSDQMTVSEAQKRLRRAGAVSHNRIFILDAEQHVIGAVSVAAVATANKSVRIAELAASAPAVLSARTSLVDAAQIEDWREFREIPVVNRDNKFVGVLEFAAIHTIIFRRSGQHGADLRGREPDVGVENLMQVFFAGTSGLWQLWADLFAGTPDTNWKSNEN
ncbi:MAG: CBS domain-containing protein, partial [Gammaproteobacteria bacterium]|nr:CBS domain-containing protein [Gammaproteobacteria bacterium]